MILLVFFGIVRVKNQKIDNYAYPKRGMRVKTTKAKVKAKKKKK